MDNNNESHDELENQERLNLSKVNRWKCCREIVRSDPDSNIIAGGFGKYKRNWFNWQLIRILRNFNRLYGIFQ